MNVYTLVFALLFLVGFHSVSAKEKQKTFQDISRNYNSELLAKSDSVLDQKTKYEVAISYYYDIDLNYRMKSERLLKELVDTAHKKATYIYTLGQLNGVFGKPTDIALVDHKKILIEHDGESYNTLVDKNEKTKVFYKRHFSALKSFYEKAYPLCEQKAESLPDMLDLENTSHLLPTFMAGCLRKHSFQANAVDRLLVYTDYRKLDCEFEKEKDREQLDKVCDAEGYKILAGGRFENLTSEQWKKVSFAINGLFNDHYTMLYHSQPYVAKPKNSKISGKVYGKMGDAMALYQNNKAGEGAKKLSTFIEKKYKKLNDSEKAELYRVLANLYYFDDKPKQSFENYGRFVDLNTNGTAERWDAIKKMHDIAFVSFTPLEYTKFVVEIFNEYGEDFNIIPSKTINNISFH